MSEHKYSKIAGFCGIIWRYLVLLNKITAHFLSRTHNQYRLLPLISLFSFLISACIFMVKAIIFNFSEVQDVGYPLSPPNLNLIDPLSNLLSNRIHPKVSPYVSIYKYVFNLYFSVSVE